MAALVATEMLNLAEIKDRDRAFLLDAQLSLFASQHTTHCPLWFPLTGVIISGIRLTAELVQCLRSYKTAFQQGYLHLA